MDLNWRTLHVFVSSTFNDMHAERDHLRHVVFPELAHRLRERRVHLHEVDLRWGVDTITLDTAQEREQKILTYCLDEARRCAPYIVILIGRRYGYVPSTSEVHAGGLTAAEVQGLSVTELEVNACLEASSGVLRHRAFLRDEPPQAPAVHGEAEGAERLEAFRQRLRALSPARCATYALREAGDLEAFGRQVRDALWEDLEAATLPTLEAGAHEWAATSIAVARRTFVGRGPLLDDLTAFCEAEAVCPVQVRHAPSGAGKSSLAAALVDRLMARGIATAAVFVGTPGFDTFIGVLRSLCDRLADLAGLERLPTDADHRVLVDGFVSLLEATAARRRVVVLMDGLDRLERSPDAQGMAWLPRRWPAGARLLVTGIDGAQVAACAVRLGVDPEPLPMLSAADGRDIVHRLAALERRQLAAPVVDALLQVRKADGGVASGNPLWLTLAFGQLSRLPGRVYQMAQKRLEARADDRLTGMLCDWVARLPAEPMALFSRLLDEAEAHLGGDVRSLARLLALGRRGWRDADLAALLAAHTGHPWLPLDLARLRSGLHGALGISQEGLWRFAHDSLAAAVTTELDPADLAALHGGITAHLTSLDPADPLRISELVHHALAAGNVDAAATELTKDIGFAGAVRAEEHLVRELQWARSDEVEVLAWPGRLLWADGLDDGQRLMLAERLWRTTDTLVRQARWARAAGLYQLLAEAYGGRLADPLDRREAQFQQARLSRSRAACTRALGDLPQTLQHLAECAQRAGALVQTADQPELPESTSLRSAHDRDEAGVFQRPKTVERQAEWCNLWLDSQLQMADLLLQTEAFREADFLLARLLTHELDIPEQLRDALTTHLPMRGRGVMLLTFGARAFFWLLKGSPQAALGDLIRARSALDTLRDILPQSLPLRREAALLQLRTSQALLLAESPGSSVNAGLDAVEAFDALCREQPAHLGPRLERVHALRCLARAWRALGLRDQAETTDGVAARELRSVLDIETTEPAAMRALAWAAGIAATTASMTDVLAAPRAEPDDPPAQRPAGDDISQVFTTNDAIDEADRQDPRRIAEWRQFLLDGPRSTDVMPDIRRADFAFQHALATHGVDALTEVAFTITDPQGNEHVRRQLKPGAARRLGVDCDALLGELEHAAASGDPDAQLALGERLLSGALGPGREHEGQALLERAAVAGSTPAAVRLGEHLLASPQGRQSWAHGAAWLERARQQGDIGALTVLSAAHLYGRGVPQDIGRAMRDLERAAQAGHPAAAYNFGLYLNLGQHVAQDLDAAVHWYEVASGLGIAAARINLAKLLLQRQAGPDGRPHFGHPDVVRAEALLEQAVSEADPAAMFTLADHLLRQVADGAAERARGLYQQAIAAGRMEALHGLGWLLLTGQGGAREVEQALTLLTQAAQAGDPRATTMLQLLAGFVQGELSPGDLSDVLDRLNLGAREKALFQEAAAAVAAYTLSQGEAGGGEVDSDSDEPQVLYKRAVHLSQVAQPRDYPGAFACYERAARAGHAASMHNLAYLYLQGQGVAQDAAAGIAWMRRSAEGGEAAAQYHMGVFLTEGIHTAPDPAEAVSWYRRAAAQGMPAALHNLAWCHLQGTGGVAVDRQRALDLFRRAAAAGQKESASMVQKLQGMAPQA